MANIGSDDVVHGSAVCSWVSSAYVPECSVTVTAWARLLAPVASLVFQWETQGFPKETYFPGSEVIFLVPC